MVDRLPPLHVVTDDAVLGADGFLERAGEVLRAGGERLALHLRGPMTGGKSLFAQARALVSLAEEVGAVLLVNDRIDVALAASAHGAQVGARGIPAREARRLLGTTRWLGVSVHSAEEAAEAAAGEPDFLLVGTLFPTPSHPGRVGAGPELLEALAPYGMPLVGIGGVTAERLPQLRRAGAGGAAVLRAVWAAEDAAAAVERLLETWMNSR